MKRKDIIDMFSSYFEQGDIESRLMFPVDGVSLIKVNYRDLQRESPELAAEIERDMVSVIRLGREALAELDYVENCHLVIEDYPIQVNKKIWELRTPDFNRIVKTEGAIERKSRLVSRICIAIYECPSCGNNLRIVQNDLILESPKRCGCGRKSNFTPIGSQKEDFCYVEICDNDADGEIHKLKVEIDETFLSKEYQECLQKGNRIAVSGQLKEEYQKLKQGGISTEISKKIVACSIQILQKQDNDKRTDYDLLFKTITPKMFEELVAKLFQKKGYKATVTPYSGDKGIDVVAEKDKEKIAIQCKLMAKDTKISNSVVQKALGSGLSPYKATKVMIVTSAEDFTPAAYHQKEGSSIECELWNRERLVAEMGAYLSGTEEGWEMYNEYMEKEEHHRQLLFEPIVEVNEIIPESFWQTKEKIKNIISDIQKRNEERMASYDEVLYRATLAGISEEKVKEIIDKLKRNGDIYEPKRGYVAII